MTDSNADSIALAFLERLWADRDSGRERTLGDYLALYPGHDEIIATEYVRALADARGEVGGDESLEAEEGRLGPYRLIQELGRGGQGIVWLAEDRRLGTEGLTRLSVHKARGVRRGPVSFPPTPGAGLARGPRAWVSASRPGLKLGEAPPGEFREGGG